MDTTNARARKREEQRLARKEKAKEARIALQDKVARQKRMKEEDYREFADRQVELNKSLMKNLDNISKVINEQGRLIAELKVGFTIQEIALGMLAEKMGISAEQLSGMVKDYVHKEAEKGKEAETVVEPVVEVADVSSEDIS